MPMYTYHCSECGGETEHVVPYANRDTPLLECDKGCQSTMTRQGFEKINMGAGRHQTAVVLGSGETVKGNFNGDYRTDRAKRAARSKK